jgi:hypothetical protein
MAVAVAVAESDRSYVQIAKDQDVESAWLW